MLLSLKNVGLVPPWLNLFLEICLTTVARTSNTMLNRSGESGHPCLIPNFRGNAFNFSPVRMFAVGLSYMAFIMLQYVLLYLLSGGFFFFNHKWMLNFVKGFLRIY